MNVILGRSDKMTASSLLLMALLLPFFLLLQPVALRAEGGSSDSAKPSAFSKPQALPMRGLPFFQDDLDLAELHQSLEQSLVYLRTVPAATRYRCGARTFSPQHLIDSLVFFQRLLNKHPSAKALNQDIQHFYDVYRMNDLIAPNAKAILITGYYYPVFKGSLTRKPPYVYPIYAVPRELQVRKTNRGKNRQQQEIGRLKEGRFVPFWTRREIEHGNMLRGQELIWLQDPFDAFELHVQGSGMVRLPDGNLRGLRYAQRNGRDYTSVGKYLVDSGCMRLEEVTMDSIRRYVAEHPEEREEILHSNASYIFFQWGPVATAIGSLGRELTPGRSIAADRRWYPPGALIFLDSRRPVIQGATENWQALRRFVTVQDAGSALVGPGRVDIFWGLGQEAGQEAGRMKEAGQVYLLMLKERLPVTVKQ